MSIWWLDHCQLVCMPTSSRQMTRLLNFFEKWMTHQFVLLSHLIICIAWGKKMSQRISGFLFLSSYLFHDSPSFKNLKTANLAYFKNMSHQIMLLSHILVEMNGLQTYVAPGASKSFWRVSTHLFHDSPNSKFQVRGLYFWAKSWMGKWSFSANDSYARSQHLQMR